MKIAVFIAFAGLAAGCGAPCGMENRSGTYLVEYDEQSGDCGPLTDEVGRVGGGGSDSCVTNYEDLSDDMCRLELDQTCTFTDGSTMSVTAVTTEAEGSEGEELTGTFNITLRDSQGAYVCKSLYGVKATRI